MGELSDKQAYVHKTEYFRGLRKPANWSEMKEEKEEKEKKTTRAQD